MTIEFCWKLTLEILILDKLSLMLCEVIWADQFCRFDVYWIQTMRQTDTHTEKQSIYVRKILKDCKGIILSDHKCIERNTRLTMVTYNNALSDQI